MKTKLIALTFFITLSAFANDPGPVTEKGELIFSDDFERDEPGKDWQLLIPTFTIENGTLKGSQTRDDHGAVGRTWYKMKDVVVEFKFKLAGSRTFSVVFDDKNHKASHAGHICRVNVTETHIRLGDDKEGIMRNDIFAMRRSDAPGKKAAAKKLIEGRGLAVKTPVAPNKWHKMTIEISGDEMRVSLNDKFVGYLKSSGLAHPTKESVHFTVVGKNTYYDEVRIWKAK